MIENDFLYSQSYILDNLLEQDKCSLPNIEVTMYFKNMELYGESTSNGAELKNELLNIYGQNYDENIIECSAEQFFVLKNLINQVKMISNSDFVHEFLGSIKEYADRITEVILKDFEHKESLTEEESKNLDYIRDFKNFMENVISILEQKNMLFDSSKAFIDIDNERDPNNFLQISSELEPEITKDIVNQYNDQWELILSPLPNDCYVYLPISDDGQSEAIKLLEEATDKLEKVYERYSNITKTRLNDTLTLLEEQINNNDLFKELVNGEMQKQESYIDDRGVKLKKNLSNILESTKQQYNYTFSQGTM